MSDTPIYDAVAKQHPVAVEALRRMQYERYMAHMERRLNHALRLSWLMPVIHSPAHYVKPTFV